MREELEPAGRLLELVIVLIGRPVRRNYRAAPGVGAAACRGPDNRLSFRCSHFEVIRSLNITRRTLEFEQKECRIYGFDMVPQKIGTTARFSTI